MKRYTLKNIKAYFQGKIRYKLYYSRFKFLIPKHIREQIDIRINSMDPVCYAQGQCKLCGCQTTALQMANKPCDKPCYPKMFDKPNWESFKEYKSVAYCMTDKYPCNLTFWILKDNKFIKLNKDE